MFDKIKKFYDMGLWSDVQVRNAVEKGIITEDEYSLIIEGR